MNFETSYQNYPFSELVRLGVALAERLVGKPAAAKVRAEQPQAEKAPANQDEELAAAA